MSYPLAACRPKANTTGVEGGEGGGGGTPATPATGAVLYLIFF